MDYLHQRKIIHRDLKAANLLMDDHGIVKVGGWVGQWGSWCVDGHGVGADWSQSPYLKWQWAMPAVMATYRSTALLLSMPPCVLLL